jgi:hypothetical protein
MGESIKPIIGDPMSDRAVYLGDGVWWQLSERQRQAGIGRSLPERIRPWGKHL